MVSLAAASLASDVAASLDSRSRRPLPPDDDEEDPEEEEYFEPEEE